MNKVTTKLRKYIFQSNYPQRVFGKELKMAIESLSDKPLRIIDIPCGNGETAYWMSKIRQVDVTACDISKHSIRSARKLFQERNLHIIEGDIYKVLGEDSKFDVVCIINSLFCLPDAEEALHCAYQAILNQGYLIVVIPNIDSTNYLNFVKDNPTLNSVEWSVSQTSEQLNNSGFKVMSVKEVARAYFFGRPTLHLFTRLKNPYLNVENCVRCIMGLGKGSYFVIVAKKVPAKN